MKNQHIPFELLDQVNSWIEKNKPKPSRQKEEARQELLKIKKAIKALYEVNCEPPRGLLEKRKALEDKLSYIIDHEDIQMLSELRERLNELVRELDHILRKTSASVKAAPKKLRVQFDDGKVFDFPKAVDTFVSVLQHMGLNLCSECEDITQLDHPVVAKRPNKYSNRKPGKIKEVDGFFIETKSSTELKAKYLKSFAEELGIDLSVDIIK